jgi:hypothetical protein
MHQVRLADSRYPPGRLTGALEYLTLARIIAGIVAALIIAAVAWYAASIPYVMPRNG